MDFNALELALTDSNLHLPAVCLALYALCVTVACCSCRSSTKPVANQDEINSRNSKLAIMLMMLLVEDPEGNSKYIEMAKRIGCSHLLTELHDKEE
jgi:hypothetical protein